MKYTSVLTRALLPLLLINPVPAATVTWIGGTGTWQDNAGDTNWSPSHEPYPDDFVVLNTPHEVTLASSNSILSLNLSGGADLVTAGYDLDLTGALQVSNAGTTLQISGAASKVAASSAAITNGGEITLLDGALDLNGTAGLDINNGTSLSGRGLLTLRANVSAGTRLLINDGTISPLGATTFDPNPGGFPIITTLPGTLQVTVPSTNARIDLDGSSEGGIVDIGKEQELSIAGYPSDPFSSQMTLRSGSTFGIVEWSINGGADISTINGGTNVPPPGHSTPAGTSTIHALEFTQAGGTITQESSDGTLYFDTPATQTAGDLVNNGIVHFGDPFSQTGGNLINNGKVVFSADATISAAANFTMPTTYSSLTLNSGATVQINQANFNADGSETVDNKLTIGSGASLNLNLGAGADEDLGCLCLLNGGTLFVSTIDNTWSLSRDVTVGASTGTSRINGEAVTFNGGVVSVGTESTLNVDPPSTWSPGVSLTVNSFAQAALTSATFNSPGAIAGTGTLRTTGQTTFTGSTTIAVGTFDWDGLTTGSTHTISDGSTLTINSPVFDDDGDMDDAITLGGNGGTLAVNGPPTWEMRNTLTANPLGIGVSTLAGTSRLVLSGSAAILDAKGATLMSAPVTFENDSTASIVAGAVLTVDGNARYEGGTISGAGTYAPPAGDNNTVSGTSTISATNLDFDRGNWVLDPGSSLTVAVSTYDAGGVIRAFDASLTLNDSGLAVTSADGKFVMDGIMNCQATTTNAAWKAGANALHIGNDYGTRDAHLNIGGAGKTQIATPVTFNSDADVFIASGATLQLLGTATFDPVYETSSAAFTGAGRLETAARVFFNEATTIDMAGGTLDLDGSDLVGDTIQIRAPLIINLATLEPFGKFNTSGTNRIEVDNLNAGSSGILTVSLDNPSDEWTLNSAGVIDLLNDKVAATLLAGSAINLNGNVRVTGDVRSTARLDIAGVIDILTANSPFHLAGGNLTTQQNTISGGTINGPGILGADSGCSLAGFGTIQAGIEFSTNSDLFADGGTLEIGGSISGVHSIGTADTDGILNVTKPWTPPATSTVLMQGGQLTGATLTNNGAGIRGHGLISAKIVNNTVLLADIPAQSLVVQTAGNDNDWDGSTDLGALQAASLGTLEIRDNGGVNFLGTVNAGSGGTVFANGFELAMEPASTLSLAAGIFRQSEGITAHLGGTIHVGAGTSTLLTNGRTGGFLFESTSSTTLGGTLQLDCPKSTVQAGAAFSGAGQLIILPSRQLIANNTANLNAAVENRGTFSPADNGVAAVAVKSFKQTATGILPLNLNGLAVSQFDSVAASGAVQLAGSISLTLGGGYVPGINDTFTILQATGGVSGTFSPLVQPAGLPAGRSFEITYLADQVQLKVVGSGTFDVWIQSFPLITDPSDRSKAANPDGDSLNNLGEFALDGDPASALSSGKVVGKVAQVGGSLALTLTLPVRNGAVPDPADPAGGELVLKQSTDLLTYRVQATNSLVTFPLDVAEVIGDDATAIQAALPALNSGWTYRTFRSPGPVTGDASEFVRVVVSE